MQIEKFQPEGERIKLEMRFTNFPALSVGPKVEISRSASETDDWLFFLPIIGKIVGLNIISFQFSQFILFDGQLRTSFVVFL